MKSLQHARDILLNGADKVAINTGAVKNPGVLTELMDLFGRQCVVVAIDAKRNYNVRKEKIFFLRMEKSFGLKYSFMVEKKALTWMLWNGQNKLKNMVQVKFF